MIYVITHKKFDDDKLDKSVYAVLHVGKGDDCSPVYLRDDTKDSIADRNPTFCELTGLYWIWKNGGDDPDELTGLVHYRRFFTDEAGYAGYIKHGKLPEIYVPGGDGPGIGSRSVILPKRYITLSTLRGSYARCHDEKDLSYVRAAMGKMCPGYISTFEKVLSGHKGFYYNMIICRRSVLCRYCEWLFPLLFEIEEQMKKSMTHENSYQERVYGFLAERLLQVWVEHEGLDIIEMPVFNTEERPVSVFKRNAVRVKYLWYKYILRKPSDTIRKEGR